MGYPRRQRNLLLLPLALALGSTLPAAIVNDNTTTDTFMTYYYSANGATQLGDSVTLGGAGRVLTSASVEFYNRAKTGGTFDSTLRLLRLRQHRR